MKPLPAAAPAHGDLAPEIGRLALQPASLLDQRLQPRRQLGGRHLQALRQALQEIVLAARLVVGELARHRLDAPDAGGDRVLADDPEQRDVAGAPDMGAAAQLDRVGLAVLAQAHRDHAHLVAVLLAEQRHGARADRVVARHDPHARLVVAAQEVVDLGLDRPDLVRRHRPGLAEVEAQPIRRHQRALLRHMLAEMPAQRCVQQVGGRMRAADAVAAGGVGLELDRVAHRQRPALEPADMDEQVAQPLLRVGDLDHGVAAADRAGVADLAARTRRRTASGW